MQKPKITNAEGLISTPDSSRLAISDSWTGHVKPVIAAKCYFIGISALVSSGRTIRWSNKGTTVSSYSDIRTYDHEMSIQQVPFGLMVLQSWKWAKGSEAEHLYSLT